MESDEEQAPGLRMDNGDNYWVEDPGYYYNKPLQAGSSRIILGVNKDNAKNRAMRYNFYYISTIEVTSGKPSYEDSNQPGPDIYAIIVQGLMDSALLFVIIILLNLLIIPFPGIAPAMAKLDMIVMGILVVELTVFGKIGGFIETSLYQNCALARFGYDWIFDWDGSAARFIIHPNEYDFNRLRWNN